METHVKPQMSEDNYVLKRNGKREPIDPNKITRRLKKLKLDVEKFLGRTLNVSVWRIAKATIGQIYDGITTSELDEEAAEVAAYITDDPDYADFAGNILVSNLEANNRDCMSFLSYAEKAYNFVEERTGHRNPLISDELMNIAKKYSHHIDRRIVMARNYLFDYFAFQTLAKGGYILNNYRQIQKNRAQITAMVPFETPQHMYMRVALGIHGTDLDSAFELYDQLSLQFGTMATPTLFNAGTPKPQCSSCFLLQMKNDSIEGIYDTLKQCALISKQAGGIGVNIHNVRANGSYIKGTNGTSNGLVPMLRVFNNTAKYVDQGGGKRKGSFAMYLEPWHADILSFLELKLANGAEDKRARDLFYALWVPDLFWKRVQKAYAQKPEDQEPPVMWSLMCPHICPGLSDCYGEEFEKLYEKYESEKKYNKQIPIKDLMKVIMSAQIETGTPYILNKDHCNRKSNQNNLGCIKSSNLCSEIIQYSSEDEISVCNLASLSLPAFVCKNTGEFDYVLLEESTRIFVKALNKVIDVNYYPVKEAENSNMRNRPIGLGVQGLADVFIKMRLPFTSDQAKIVNRNIAEVMYFGCMTESHALAVKEGYYPSMMKNGGAPISKGIFQFELWKQDFINTKNHDGWKPDEKLNLDWDGLRANILKPRPDGTPTGVRNSLVICKMPTASTSCIMGNTECFEPYFGMIYVRRTKAGEFFQYCRPLIEDLVKLGLWKTEIHPATKKPYIPIKEKIKEAQGSIQNIPEIPDELKKLYVTVFDLKLKDLTIMARDRGLFTDQSESLNVYFKNTDNMMPKLLQYMVYAWELGLKTGSYYCRTLQQTEALDFSGMNNHEAECVSCSG